ncbi:hypothetical protein [Hydrogenophaga sp. 2FB]|uniref:hypothetical protein n=1 Tax=Hydrogenophaga sp. 2FB TaxID=2502187 RepID=UPI0010FA14B4|nr:hypothetical protein [Hydrogenophaga sp. 2FB]
MTTNPFYFGAPKASAVFTDAQILEFQREAAMSAKGRDDLTLRTVRMALDALNMRPDEIRKAKAYLCPDPIEGDRLPAIGSRVLIHLASQDEWVEHTVTGFYVWGPLAGVSPAYSRVFVTVISDDGYPNSRLLADVRPTTGAASPDSCGPNTTDGESQAALTLTDEARVAVAQLTMPPSGTGISTMSLPGAHDLPPGDHLLFADPICAASANAMVHASSQSILPLAIICVSAGSLRHQLNVINQAFRMPEGTYQLFTTPAPGAAPRVQSVVPMTVPEFERLTKNGVRFAREHVANASTAAGGIVSPVLMSAPIAHIDVEAWGNGADTAHCFSSMPFPGSEPVFLEIAQVAQPILDL